MLCISLTSSRLYPCSCLLHPVSDGVLVWLPVWSEVQTVCIWSSWCHCRHKTPSYLASFKSTLLQDWLHGFPWLFTDTSELIRILLLRFSVFPRFICWFRVVDYRHGTGSQFVTQRPSDPGIQRPGDPVDPMTLFYNELQMSTYVADKRLQWARGLPVFIAVWRLHASGK